MCGIVAVIGHGDADLENRRQEALDILNHRGPDDEGSWADGYAWLGHRRLSIIDLTSGGHQPMVHQPTGAVITYNGEIYNYIELRAELEAAGHVFSTHSDTEVLLAAYLKWGEDCLSRLNGMWSFLIWDPRRRKAFFARDRLGVKPLYFARVNGGLSVASEPKALLALHPELRKPDDASIYALLGEGDLYGSDRSFYAGIHVLQAGHCGTYDPGTTAGVIRKYWTPPTPSEDPLNYEQALETFSDLFADAVRLRMRSDVPVGFTLSGGLDSSAILQSAVTASGSAGNMLRAFTSVYEAAPGTQGGDERNWARLVAGKYQNVDLEEVSASAGDWLKILELVVWHMDGPGSSPAVFPLWMIMQRARSAGIPVLLEGQGADELLGGYTHYAALALWSSLAQRRPSTFAKDFGSYAETFPLPRLAAFMVRERTSFATRAYRRRVGALGTLDPDFVRRYETTRQPESVRTVNERLGKDLTRDILPGLLHYGDAVSMAHSVENRLPFLDYRLVELVTSLPGDYKVGGGQTKRILRDHLRSVDLAAIANRRDKRGYPTPANTWLAANDGEILKSLLLSPDAHIQAYCRPERVRRLIDHHISGRGGAGLHLYRLLTTELWLRTCIAAK